MDSETYTHPHAIWQRHTLCPAHMPPISLPSSRATSRTPSPRRGAPIWQQKGPLPSARASSPPTAANQQEIATLCLRLLQNYLMRINALLVERTLAQH